MRIVLSTFFIVPYSQTTRKTSPRASWVCGPLSSDEINFTAATFHFGLGFSEHHRMVTDLKLASSGATGGLGCD